MIPERFKKLKLYKLARWLVRKLRAFKDYIDIVRTPRRHEKSLNRVRESAKHRKVNVAFFVIHAAVWKYESLYELLKQDERFEPIIFICPAVNYGKENMIMEIEKTANYLKKNNYDSICTYDKEKDTYLNIKKDFDLDIIFYTNPHKGLIKKEYFITNFKEYLTCYLPYGFGSSYTDSLFHGDLFYSILWKFFCETEIHKESIIKHSKNKGRNVRVTGYPTMDDLKYGEREENGRWKNTNKKLKRIIWAPHHTFEKNEILNYSNFLIHSNFMLEMLDKYKDKIQIAFKPHPLLEIKLYNLEGWGKERTDDYYAIWASRENSQLETEDYIDLFNSSDAMILDSASFTAEYLCCGKPSMFFMKNADVYDQFNDFGKMALNQNYIGESEKDIIDFIEMVINGEDSKEETRRDFYMNKIYRSTKVSLDIYQDIVSSLYD